MASVLLPRVLRAGARPSSSSRKIMLGARRPACVRRMTWVLVADNCHSQSITWVLSIMFAYASQTCSHMFSAAAFCTQPRGVMHANPLHYMQAPCHTMPHLFKQKAKRALSLAAKLTQAICTLGGHRNEMWNPLSMC